MKAEVDFKESAGPKKIRPKVTLTKSFSVSNANAVKLQLLLFNHSLLPLTWDYHSILMPGSYRMAHETASEAAFERAIKIEAELKVKFISEILSDRVDKFLKLQGTYSE